MVCQQQGSGLGYGSTAGIHSQVTEDRIQYTATAAAVDADTESRLEELRAEIRINPGQSVAQNELPKRLVDLASESRVEVVDSFRESTVPLTETEKVAMQKGRFSSGGESDADDVDDTLYG